MTRLPISDTNSQNDFSKTLEEKDAFCIPIRFIVAALVLLTTVVLYICRINLSIAIVVMSNYTKSDSVNGSDFCDSDEEKSNSTKTKQNEGEFNWSETDQGVILGSFFWGYILFQVVGGRLSEIFGAKWLCGGGVAMSIIINLLTPTIARTNYSLLLASRVALGVCQSFVIPSCYALFAKWAPDHERSTVLSFPTIGGNIGSIAISAMAGYLSKHGFAGGWPSVFYVSAMVAFAWLICWIIFIRSDPKDHPWISKKELNYIKSNINSNTNQKSKKSVPWLKIFTSTPVLAAITVKFTINWNYILLILKLPSYLQTVLKYPVDQNGFISSLVYIALTISLFSGGFLADFFGRKNIVRKTILRKIFEGIATIGSASCLAIIPLVGCDRNLVIALLIIAMLAFGMQAGGDIPIVADMTNDYAATVFAISNTVAFTCGFLTPLVIGVILEASDQIRRQWGYVFYLSAALNVFGAIIFIIFGSAEQQHWDKEEEKPTEVTPVVTKM